MIIFILIRLLNVFSYIVDIVVLFRHFLFLLFFFDIFWIFIFYNSYRRSFIFFIDSEEVIHFTFLIEKIFCFLVRCLEISLIIVLIFDLIKKTKLVISHFSGIITYWVLNCSFTINLATLPQYVLIVFV